MHFLCHLSVQVYKHGKPLIELAQGLAFSLHIMLLHRERVAKLRSACHMATCEA